MASYVEVYIFDGFVLFPIVSSLHFTCDDVIPTITLSLYFCCSQTSRLFLYSIVSFSSLLFLYSILSFSSLLFLYSIVSFSSLLFLYSIVSFSSLLFLYSIVSFSSFTGIVNIRYVCLKKCNPSPRASVNHYLFCTVFFVLS